MEKNWYNKSSKEIFEEFGITEESGLSDEQVLANREKFGSNELQAQKKKSLFVKFLEQFKDFMIIVLIIAAVVSGVVGYIEDGKITDSIIILVVVIVNAIIGVAQEAKAEKSLEALQKLSSHSAKVIRNGEINVIASRELVPGDIVVLDTGDYVPADLRIIESANLKAQEASLTGESVPSEKNIGVIENDKVGVGDRFNMLFSSSLITYGRGKGIVVETGMNTEVGKIAGIISNTVKSETPLQTKLNKLGKTLGIAALVICLIIFAIGLLYGKAPLDMFMTAVSLAVAAIPEGLAAVSTIVLAIGVQRMVKRNAIVKKLPAVETLGSASVICSDKTGTLTQNKMTVEKVFVDGKLYNLKEIESSEGDDSKEESNNKEIPDLKRLVHISMLCNDTKVSANNELTGDPTETALVDMGFKLDFTPELYVSYPRVEEIPFDSERKLMTTVHQVGDKYLVYTKGGVDELLKRCKSYIMDGNVKNDLDSFKSQIMAQNEQMAENALRVLAMGYKDLDHMPTKEEMESIESDLVYVGMVGMIDPPREEVKAAVDKCKSAGIKTVMITGDHKITAMAIAKALGIMEDGDEAITGLELEDMSDEELIKRVKNIAVYARVAPEHKVRIVKAWQANGEIVAMTGDGVNDAPALKTSDIGCAMGIVGTDVSKEAADVILTDDNFSTIVSAVEEGRRIYDNILKAIQFLLSSNVGEIIILFLAILIAPILANQFGIDIRLIEPLLPIHILWVNLVTDSLPALALAVDPAEKDIMNRNPNKKQKGIFTTGMTWRIVYQGLMIGLLTLTAFILGLSTKNVPVIEGKSSEEVRVMIAQTMAFIVLALSELVHVFNIRNNRKSMFISGLFSNLILIGAIVVSAGLMFVVLLIPGLRNIFSIVMLPTECIIETICLVFAPIVIVELFKLFKINTIKGE